MVTKRAGRKGAPTEFVEFAVSGQLVKFVAQKGAGGMWFIFAVAPGKKGAVITVRTFGTDERALSIENARTLAMAVDKGVLIPCHVLDALKQ